MVLRPWQHLRLGYTLRSRKRPEPCRGQKEWQRLPVKYPGTMLLLQDFQPGGPEQLTGADDPRHALQQNGGLADTWYPDDGDSLRRHS